jgi:lipoprotein signal peptidase
MTQPADNLAYAFRSPLAWARLLIPATLGLVADLWLKVWSFPDGVPAANPLVQIPAGRNPVQLYPPTPVIPHILGFTTIINHGAVFGIGQGMVAFFLLFSILAMAMILWAFLTSRRDQWLVQIALGMITAGALGNLYDRAIHGGVRDMLQFLCFRFRPIHLFGFQFPSGPIFPDGTIDWYPYIFNVADVMLCVGVPLLMLCWLVGGARGKTEAAKQG